jgi:hypothetical protein
MKVPQAHYQFFAVEGIKRRRHPEVVPGDDAQIARKKTYKIPLRASQSFLKHVSILSLI